MPPPVTAEFLGQDRVTLLGRPLPSTDGVCWDLFRIVSCLPPGKDAKRLLTVDDGVLSLATDLVTLDVHTFLAAIYDGNHARKEERFHDAIAAYLHARGLYVGPLLAGRDEDFEWLTVPVEGALTLREAYRHRERVATERLAELLVATGRPAEAAPLYADLMRDPGPPRSEADELEQFVFRFVPMTAGPSTALVRTLGSRAS